MSQRIIHYRPPVLHEADAISDCIGAATGGPAVSAERAQNFHDVSGPAAIANRITRGDLTLLAADDESNIAGFIAYRRVNHLSLLFVRNSFQSMGIGRALIEKTRPRFESVTVNSTDAAVGFYRHLGFEFAGARHLKRDSWATPMVWRVDQ